MRKFFVVMMALVLASAFAVAQENSQSQQPQPQQPAQQTTTTTQSTSTTTQAQNPTTIQGCLQATDTGFAVVDKSGTRYEISGDNDQLKAQVGHEVQITGNVAQQAASTQPQQQQPTQAGAPQVGTNRIDMTSVKSVSDTCSQSPSTPPSSQLPPSPKL